MAIHGAGEVTKTPMITTMVAGETVTRMITVMATLSNVEEGMPPMITSRATITPAGEIRMTTIKVAIPVEAVILPTLREGEILGGITRTRTTCQTDGPSRITTSQTITSGTTIPQAHGSTTRMVEAIPVGAETGASQKIQLLGEI
jgi:hypothetical protein